MRIISVDDEQLILDDFVEMLESMPEVDEVHGFTNCNDALQFIRDNSVDVAFCDIHMTEMDGITLAKKIKAMCPSVNIVFLTAYSEYSMDAMKLHASGYLMKPACKEDVRKELQDLRIPPETHSRSRIKAQCFGNFEIYIDGYPCNFKYIKTKELVAYLIDRRGALCTNGEIIGALWEDKELTMSLENYLRNLVSDMRAVFKKNDVEEVIIKKKGMIAIVPSAIDCDYYKWIEGDPLAINSYSGKYMEQYSWAESTLAGIEKTMLLQ